MAKRLGVTPRAVSGWERGESEPEPAKLTALSDFLNTELTWLLGKNATAAVLVTPRKTTRKAKQMPPESLLSYDMWSIWDKANSEQRKLIVGIANMVLKTGKGD